MDFYANGDVSYCWKVCFYLLSNKRHGARGNYPHTLPFDRPACVNNMLINALKN